MVIRHGDYSTGLYTDRSVEGIVVCPLGIVMKWLVFFGLCVAVALSSPSPDDDQDDDILDKESRRFQTLSLKLVDEHDGQKRNRVNDNLRDDRRNRDDLGSLRDVVRDTYEVEASNKVGPKDVLLDDAKNSQLDLLAKELEQLSTKYQGRGVLKVAYTSSKLYNLGSLHFKYVAPEDNSYSYQYGYNNYYNKGSDNVYEYYNDKGYYKRPYYGAKGNSRNDKGAHTHENEKAAVYDPSKYSHPNYYKGTYNYDNDKYVSQYYNKNTYNYDSDKSPYYYYYNNYKYNNPNPYYGREEKLYSPYVVKRPQPSYNDLYYSDPSYNLNQYKPDYSGNVYNAQGYLRERQDDDDDDDNDRK
ncbi:unnamed protein product, partial [Iphiclides podalirius]